MSGQADDTLIERQRIREVIERYFFAHDVHDSALLESCFTADLNASYMNGKATCSSLAEFMVLMQAPAATAFKHQAHITSHCHITVSGDTAVAETLAVIFFAQGRPGIALVRSGRYHDRLRKEDGVWKICEREHLSLWQAEMTEGAAGAPVVAKG